MVASPLHSLGRWEGYPIHKPIQVVSRFHLQNSCRRALIGGRGIVPERDLLAPCPGPPRGGLGRRGALGSNTRGLGAPRPSRTASRCARLAAAVRAKSSRERKDSRPTHSYNRSGGRASGGDDASAARARRTSARSAAWKPRILSGE